MKKRLLSILLAALMLVGMLPVTALATVDLPTEATWLINEGDNHVWYKLDGTTLTIGGTGAMPNYTGDRPWKDAQSTITTVVIQSGVTAIGDRAFMGCESLTGVTFPNPNSVTSIGKYAFSGCIALASVEIPSGVTSIGEQAFNECAKLASVTFPTTLTTIDGMAFCKCSSLESVTIPEGVTSIKGSAFKECTKLARVTLPTTLTEVYASAFNGCSELKSITIPANVTYIGSGAFSGCTKLTSLTVKATTPPTLDGPLFDSTPSGLKIYVPADKVDTYKNSSGEPFPWVNYTDRITPIMTKPDEATWLVENETWYQLIENTPATDSKTYTLTIGGTGAMPDYSSSRPWNSDVSNITTIVIKSGVTSIGQYAFSTHMNLASVTIPASVTNIGYRAFYTCQHLNTVTFEEGSKLENIGNNAFDTCNELESITIPASVTSIGECAFVSCEKLESITIPASVTSIGKGIFNDCRNLKTIDVAEGNSNYTSVDGVLFNEEMSTLIAYPAKKNATAYTIPEGVTEIADYAFVRSGITGITLPSTLTSIGQGVFGSYSYLTSIILKAKTSPILCTDGAEVFAHFNSCSLYVPYGTKESYANNNGWKTYITPEDPYTTYFNKFEEAYMVSMAKTSNGSVSVSKDFFPVDTYTEEDKTVTVTVTPDKGYQLKSLIYNDGENHDITEAKSFTMPRANVTVTAAFEAQANSTYKFVVTAPDALKVNEESTDASVRLCVNEAKDLGYDKVLIKVEMTAKPVGSNPKILATDSQSVEWNIAEVGQWGPNEGFAVSKDYDVTTPLKLKFDKAGTYTATFKLIDLNNNDAVICESSKTITVNKTSVTITAAADDFTYGTTGKTGYKDVSVADNLVAASDLVATYYKDNGEGADPRWTELETVPTDAGNYKVVLSVPESNDAYTGSEDILFTIAKKTITVAIVPVKDKVYNGKTDDASITTASVTFKTGDLVNNDVVTISGITGTYASANVSDTQTVNLSGTWVLGGTSAANYVLAAEGQPTTTTGKITKAPLTIKAKDKSIAYGEAAANDGVEYSGFVNSETESVLGGELSYAYKVQNSDADYTTSSPVGTYDIIPSGLTSNNYEITFAKGTLTVGAKEIEKPTADTNTFTYTGDKQTYTPVGFNSNTMEISGNTQTNANETGYTVTVAPKDNYVWSAEGDCKFTWVIAKKTITITPNANQKKTYGESDPAFAYTHDALCGTDTISGALSRASGENYSASGYAFTLGTLAVNPASNAGNYTLTLAETAPVFMIEKKAITVSDIVVADKVYDGNTDGVVITDYTLNDKKTEDTLMLTGITGTYASSNVNAAQTVTLNASSEWTLGGTAKDNYVLAAEGQPTTAIGKITKATQAAPSAPTVSGSTVTVAAADRTKKLEYSIDGDNAWVSVPTLDASGAFTISGLAASNHNVYLRVRESSNYFASSSVSTSFTLTQFSVAYNANGGIGSIASQTATAPATITVANGSGFSRTGYTFDGWKDETGTDHAVGSTVSTGMTLYAQWTPNTYTVQFNANGGSGTVDNQSFTYDADATALIPNAFARDNYTFAGWATSANGPVLYSDEQSVKNLAGSGTVTLYAVWAQNVYSITVNITSPQSGAVQVKLRQGNAVYAVQNNISMNANGNKYTGSYSFTNVPAGTYNIEVTQTIDGDKNVTMTQLVVLTTNAEENISLPESGVNSKLEVEKDTLPTVVGGLNEEAESNRQNGKDITVKMTVEKQEEQQLAATANETDKATQDAISEIKATANGTALEFMNIEIEKTTVETGKVDVTEAITETSNVLELVFSYEMNGKKNIQIYRQHGDAVQTFMKLDTKPTTDYKDGTFYVDTVGSLIYVYAMKFSTYAIGYEEDEPETYTVTFNMNGHGTQITAQTVESGRKASKPADPIASGYTFGGWYADADFSSKFDFNTAITANTTIYAKWTKNSITPPVPVTPSYTVTGADTENGKLTVSTKNASAGQTVTITVKPDEGYKLNTLTVKDAKGTVLTLTKVSDTTYTFKMPSGNVTISATFKSASAADECLRDAACPMAAFSDLDMTKWYHDGIHYCLEEGLMNGVGGGKFNPNGTTTRAMIVTMLWRLEGKPVANYAMSFKDVPAGQWYTEAVRWALANKIVEGYSADKFGPDDIITREQLATILYRYAKRNGEGFTGSWHFPLDFVDTAKISTWANEAIHWCSMNGIVNGKDGKVFDPQGKATRAEAAAMIQRFCER